MSKPICQIFYRFFLFLFTSFVLFLITFKETTGKIEDLLIEINACKDHPTTPYTRKSIYRQNKNHIIVKSIHFALRSESKKSHLVLFYTFFFSR